MNITRINHAAVNVEGKVDEAKNFYLELLGLPKVPVQLPGQEPIHDTTNGFWIEKNGVQMHIIGREPLGGSPDPTQAHISWYVENLAEARSELEAAGHAMRTMGEGLGEIIWVFDPSGNIVEFQQDPECA